MKRQKNTDFILPDITIVVAIVSIFEVLVESSFQDMIKNNRLKQAAEGLKSDLQWMLAETIKQSRKLKVSIVLVLSQLVAGAACTFQKVN